MKTKELRLLIREELAKELKENKRPDYPDVDKDGDREESMEKALKDKKAAEEKDVKEAYADLSPEERLKVGKEYDHETIAQAYLNKMGRDSNLKSDDLLKIGKKVVFLNYDGDLGAAYKDLVKEDINEEFKGETGEKRLDDLLDIILKYVEDPDNAEEELANYRERGYPGFSDMLKANLDRDLDFQTWVQVGHDRGLEEGEGSTLKLSVRDMAKLHKDGKLEIDGHTILYATGKPKVNEDIKSVDDSIESEIRRKVGANFATWMSPDNPPFSKEFLYNPKYFEPLIKGIMDIINTRNLNEDVDLGHVDNEPHMLKADLYRIGKYAMELYKILDGFDNGDDEFDFPHWWQSKIVKAKSMLVSAKHYLDFELNEPEIDAMVNVASEEEIIDEELNEIDIHALPPYVGSGMSKMEAAKAVLKDEGKSPEEIKAIIDKAMFTPEFDKLVARYKDSR